jgi:flagellar hook-associated protein 1 FlgK
VTAAAANGGNAQPTVSIEDASVLQPSDYELSYDGGQYALRRLSDGVVQVLGAPSAVVDGLRLSLPGGARDGDRFLVRAAGAFAAGARSLLTQPDRIATALPLVAQTGASNGGDVEVTALELDAIASPAGSSVTITFDGAGRYQLTGPGTPPGSNPQTYRPGDAIAFLGGTVRLTGTPAAGDTVSIVPTAAPAADNRNARALQALGDAGIVDGVRVIDRYASLVGEVGLRTQSATSSAEMSRRMHEDAERARTAMSGVNLDEEAARLLQYQQAYQAAAKVVATANEMFRALLDAAG